jgi:integrase
VAAGEATVRVMLCGPNTAYGAKRRRGLKNYIWYAYWYDGRIRRERSLNVPHGQDYWPALEALIANQAGAAAAVANAADQITSILDHYWQERGRFAVDARGCKNRIENLKKFFAKDTLDTLTETRCREYDATRRKRGTARVELVTLATAIRYGAVLTSPPRHRLVAVWRPPEPESKDRVMSRSEQARLLWRWRRRRHFRLILRLLIATSARITSVLELRWTRDDKGGWVDLEGGHIHLNPHGRAITNKRKPVVPIPPHLYPALRAAKALGSEWVCVSPSRGRVPSLRTFDRAWKVACGRLGIHGTTPHTTRHTRITELVKAKEHPTLVSHLAGLTMATMHKKYLHLQADDLQGLVKRKSRAGA